MSKEAYDVVNVGAGIVGAACAGALRHASKAWLSPPAQQSVPAFREESFNELERRHPSNHNPFQ